MKDYIISSSTLAIIPINETKSKIYEKDNVIVVDKNAFKIVEENCEYYGSSYQGRKKGTEKLIGVTHKSPILIESKNNLIFFPTSSPRLKSCGWISLSNIEDFKAYDDQSLITFQNNLTMEIGVSIKSFNNQVLRATRLESVIRKRQEKIEKNI